MINTKTVIDSANKNDRQFTYENLTNVAFHPCVNEFTATVTEIYKKHFFSKPIKTEVNCTICLWGDEWLLEY